MAKRTKAGTDRGTAAQRWAGRIEGWRASGQTQVRYCADHELSVWVLRKWIVKLGSSRSRSKSRPVMLPIPLRPATPATLPSLEREAALEIVLPNGTAIRASGPIAAELTLSIARALRC